MAVLVYFTGKQILLFWSCNSRSDTRVQGATPYSAYCRPISSTTACIDSVLFFGRHFSRLTVLFNSSKSRTIVSSLGMIESSAINHTALNQCRLARRLRRRPNIIFVFTGLHARWRMGMIYRHILKAVRIYK